MPSDKDILKKKLERLESVPKDFIDKIPEAEAKIYNDVLKALKKLKLDENGNIILNKENFALIEVLGSDFEAAVEQSGYYKDLTEFIKEFNTQKNLNSQYFTKTLENFEDKDVFDQTYEITKRQAVDILAESAVKDNVNLFKDILNNSISNSSNILDLTKQLEENLKGTTDAAGGSFTKYAKQEASDLFSIGERNYTAVVSDSFGIQFYYYAGGEMDTTRCFCKERVGKTFHKKEIEAWGNGRTTAGDVDSCGFPWQGMAKGTNDTTIFSLLGGYNCQHSLIPRDIGEVPKDVIERAIDNGYLKEDDE